MRRVAVMSLREKLNDLMRAAARTSILPGREPIADRTSFETVG
jgi:hypothetical protein